jgi:hypothetical protein
MMKVATGRKQEWTVKGSHQRLIKVVLFSVIAKLMGLG